MKKITLLALLLTTLAFACNKDEEADTPSTTAPISGSVMLYDEATNTADNSGMTVTVENSNPVLSTTTAADGKYRIGNVPFGFKNLVFEKAGYGVFKIFGIDHQLNSGTGTQLTNINSLGRSSSTTITALVSQLVAGDLVINPTLSPAPIAGAPRYMRLFFHTANTVSNTVYTKYTEIYTVRNNPGNIVLTKTFLNGQGFASGATIWVKAYGESFWSNTYIDPGLNRNVFPNLNATSAAAISVVVP